MDKLDILRMGLIALIFTGVVLWMVMILVGLTAVEMKLGRLIQIISGEAISDDD